MWANVVTNRRWVWPLFALLFIGTVVFAVLWMSGVVHPVTGIANAAGFAICAIGLVAWHLATRGLRR